jgi:hypothetical protein
MKKLRLGILMVLYLILIFTLFTQSIKFIRVEYEITSKTSKVRDGDTFEIPDHPAIRLADIDSPESIEQGGPEATFALTQLISEKTVHLDIDNVHHYDSSGKRLVCVVYVEHNRTHLINVNQALVVLGQASIVDHDNQWDPHTWSLYVAKPSNNTIYQIMGGSAIIGLIIIIGLNRGLSFVNKKIKRKYETIFPQKNTKGAASMG